MPKNDNALPKLEDWLAPWERDQDGNELPEDDKKIEPDKLKRYLHGLLTDKSRLKVQVDTGADKLTELEQQLQNAKSPEDFTKLQGELEKAQQERDAAKGGASGENLRLRVALAKGLTLKQAQRLVGETEDELLEDADELLASFGGSGNPGGTDEDGEPQPRETGVRRSPAPQRQTVGTPRNDDRNREPEIDYSKLVDDRLSR